MTNQRLAEIARSVIVDQGLPFDLLTVTWSPSGLEMRLRRQTGTILSLTVPDGRPVAVRLAIQDRLEAEF